MRIQCTCARCGAVFSVVPAQVKRGKGKYCSKPCADATRRLQVERACAICGATYRVKRSVLSYGRGEYCSVPCRSAAASKPLGASTCQRCGVVFSVAAWRLEKGEGRFCSRACRDAGAHDHRRHPSIVSDCPRCGTTFESRRRERRTYCSRSCAKADTIANIPGFKPTAFTATCEQCGKAYTTTPAATRGRFCSRACFGAWMADGNAPSGPNNPLWRGGYDPYYGTSWRPARRAARLRDKVCQDCGLTPTENGRALDVHHIVPFRTFGRERHVEANALANLVTLCPECHIRREWATNWRHVE